MEIAPGIHSLGQRRGGHVHAFLLDDGDALTLIDTLFDTDAHRVLAAAAAAEPAGDRPASHPADPRPPLAPRRPGGARSA